MSDFKVIDMHCDTMTGLCRKNGDFRSNDMHIDLTKMEQGNYLMQCFAIFIYLKGTDKPYEAANHYMDFFDKVMKENSDRIAQVTTVQEILDNYARGKTSAMLTIEEGGVLEGSLEKLQHFYDRGVRMITLTWNFENEIAYPNNVYEEVPHSDDTFFTVRVSPPISITLSCTFTLSSTMTQIISIHIVPTMLYILLFIITCFKLRGIPSAYPIGIVAIFAFPVEMYEAPYPTKSFSFIVLISITSLYKVMAVFKFKLFVIVVLLIFNFFFL